MQLATEGRAVVWVGLPIVSDRGAGVSSRDRTRLRSAPDRLPNVAYLDTWDMFAAPDGGYTAYYRDGNRVTQVRESTACTSTPLATRC